MKKKTKGLWIAWLLVLPVVIVRAFTTLYPIIMTFINSTYDMSLLKGNNFQFIGLENYLRIFEDQKLLSSIGFTVKFTVVSMFFHLVLGVILALMLNMKIKGKKFLRTIVLIPSALIPGIVTARPLYDLMKRFGLVDTFPGLIIMYTSALIPFTMLILGNFLSEIPISLDEAAEIDGANMFQKLFYITLPLMKPAIATILIINFINCLNDLFTPLFFAQKIEVLSVAITTIPRETSYSMPWDLISTVGCIILLPIVIFVLIFEKQIMEGVMAGGVKQ